MAAGAAFSTVAADVVGADFVGVEFVGVWSFVFAHPGQLAGERCLGLGLPTCQPLDISSFFQDVLDRCLVCPSGRQHLERRRRICVFAGFFRG
jgi:hypothetical protein